MRNDGCDIPNIIKILGVLLAVIIVLYFVGKLLGYVEANKFLKDHGSLVGAVLGALVLTATVFFTITRQSADVQKQIEAQRNIQEDIRLNDKKEAFAHTLVEVEDQFERAYIETIEALAHFVTDEQRESIDESSMPDDLKATMQNIHFKGYTDQDVEAIIASKVQSITRMRTFYSDTLNRLYFQIPIYGDLKIKKKEMADILIKMFSFKANNKMDNRFIEYFEEQYVIFNEYTKLKNDLVREITETKKLANSIDGPKYG